MTCLAAECRNTAPNDYFFFGDIDPSHWGTNAEKDVPLLSDSVLDSAVKPVAGKVISEVGNALVKWKSFPSIVVKL